MASANVHEFTDDNFQQEVLSSDTPVLVDFWAEWCQPCKMLAPTIDKLADHYGDKVKVGKVDTDANRQVSMEYGISAIPTVMLFKGGEMIKNWIGLTSEGDLTAFIDEHVA